MKKALAILMTVVLVFSMSFSTIAVSGKSNKGNGKSSKNFEVQKSEVQKPNVEKQKDKKSEVQKPNAEKQKDKKPETQKSNAQKKFKVELNNLKKEITKQKQEFGKEKELLEAEYQELLASGDTEGAAALLEKINAFDTQMAQLKTQMKKIINERHMIVKTLYSEEELGKFDSAAQLIEKMYADAAALGAGSVIVKNNLIKFEAPPYIKGGKTLIPVRAIAEELGAIVSWDGETQSVTITKDNKEVVMTINSTTVLVDGVPVDMSTKAEITCGRTYIPIRFLAETFGLKVNWDGENEIIDIEDDASAEDETAAEEETEEETDASESETPAQSDTTEGDGTASDTAEETDTADGETTADTDTPVEESTAAGE